MKDLTLEMIKALTNDVSFTRDQIIRHIKDDTGIDLSEYATDPNLTNDGFADIIWSVYLKLKEESKKLTEKYEQLPDMTEILKEVKE